MSSKHASRRKFLQQSGQVLTAASYLYGMDNLIQLMFQRNFAHADTAGYPYKYINILTTGGPPRWYFDQPLNPNNSDSDFLHDEAGFGTQLQLSGTKLNPVYKTVKQNFGGEQIALPPVWNLKSAYHGTALSELLTEMIMIRGVDMEINSHSVNRERTVRPFAASPSITGLVGARSESPTPAIGYTTSSATQVFKSANATAGVSVNRSSPIADIVKPFSPTAGNVVRKYDNLDYEIKQALRQLDRFAIDRDLASRGSEANLASTYEFFDRNLDAFAEKYTKILNRYKQIVAKEAAAEFPGITTDLARAKPDQSNRYRVDAGKVLGATDNLATLLKSARLSTIADAFAFCEFAITENLTSAITVDLGTLSLQNFKGMNVANDQHFVGSVISIIATSIYFRATLSCTTELRNALVTAGVWDKTVVHFASEFSRTPRKDFSGADHGFNSGSASIISGMIKEGGLVGNIFKKDVSTNGRATYTGTWGLAAPTIVEGSTARPLINDDVVSTVCEMLQIPKIGTKGLSLVKNSSGSVSLNYRSHKNV